MGQSGQKHEGVGVFSCTVILIKLYAFVGLNCNKDQGFSNFRDQGNISSFKFTDRIQNVLENNIKLNLISYQRISKCNAQAHVQFLWLTAFLSGPGAFRHCCFVTETVPP